MLVHAWRNKRNWTAELRARAQNVGRDVDDNRPRPSTSSPVETFGYHAGQVFNLAVDYGYLEAFQPRGSRPALKKKVRG